MWFDRTKNNGKQPSNTTPIPARSEPRPIKKQPSNRTPVPHMNHRTFTIQDVSQDQVARAIQQIGKRLARMEALIDKACDAEDNLIYSFHPHLSRTEAAQCYALLEGITVPEDAKQIGLGFYIDEDDIVYRHGTNEIVAGYFGHVIFKMSPDPLNTAFRL